MTEQLLPCPFCGCAAELLYHWPSSGDISDQHCYVGCGSCDAEYDCDLPKGVAIMAWNNRTPHTEPTP